MLVRGRVLADKSCRPTRQARWGELLDRAIFPILLGMDEKRLPTPHNNLFHYSFSQLPTVRSLIETRFAPDVIKELDLDTLSLEKDSFIDPQLRESYSDLLYSVQLKNQQMAVVQALVYFLFEHKSEAEPLTAFQMLRYIVRIWEQRLRNDLPLCPIIPLVVYQG